MTIDQDVSHSSLKELVTKDEEYKAASNILIRKIKFKDNQNTLSYINVYLLPTDRMSNLLKCLQNRLSLNTS